MKLKLFLEPSLDWHIIPIALHTIFFHIVVTVFRLPNYDVTSVEESLESFEKCEWNLFEYKSNEMKLHKIFEKYRSIAN